MTKAVLEAGGGEDASGRVVSSILGTVVTWLS